MNQLLRSSLASAAIVLSGPASAAFIGDYAVSNWDASPAGGSISTGSAPNSIQLTSSDSGSFNSEDTDFTIAATADGEVRFRWSYRTYDGSGPDWDPFGWLLNGVFTQLTSGSRLVQGGSVSFNVNDGDVFGFRANSFDSIFGPAVTTISDFSAPQDDNRISEPGSLALAALALAGVAGFRRRKAA